MINVLRCGARVVVHLALCFDWIGASGWANGAHDCEMEVVHKLQDATRNQGSVTLMRETANGD
eukprot:5840014-Amphidinium_carterae.1